MLPELALVLVLLFSEQALPETPSGVAAEARVAARSQRQGLC